MDVTEAIRSKRAVREFEDKPVAREHILKILEAGRRAQSSKNTQPWQFVVIENRDTLKALSETGKFAGHLAGAAFAIALVANQDTNWIGFDLGQAAAYMQLEGWDLGIGSCIAAIYEPDKAKEILHIPAEMTFYAALSFGYPAPGWEPAKMGGRKPVQDIAHWENW
jgi:nitroreductase